MATKTLTRLLSTSMSQQLNKKIGLVGSCFDKGQPRDGVQYGPKAFRENGLIQKFDDLHIDYKDYGDINVKDVLDSQSDLSTSTPPAKLPEKLINSKLKNVQLVAGFSKLLSEKVHQCLKDDRICLNIGGDHTLDAHGDVNTEKTTNSGNIHGMVLSFFIQGIQNEIENSPDLTSLFHSITPNLDCSSLCYIGLRDLDPPERHLLDSLQIKYFTMGDVDKLGISETTSRALDILKPSANKPLHVSFDADSLDPCYAPSTGTPVPGGLTLDEAVTLAKTVAATNAIRCIDFVEVNPKIGEAKDVMKTVDNSIKILLSLLGLTK